MSGLLLAPFAAVLLVCRLGAAESLIIVVNDETGAAGRARAPVCAKIQLPDSLRKINFVMPAFPNDREVPLHNDEPLILKHRLWIHNGWADKNKLADVWLGYCNQPAVTVEK